jgi:SAM-dependent methyltransferase
MHSSGNYVFGGGQTELQRLIVQAAGLEAEASWLLGNVPVRSGWRAADIGCGPIGILDLLSQRVGPLGRVVGLEPEPRFADMAAREVERRELRNVRVVRGDAQSPCLEHGSFDFVHERLVLMNMPDTERRRFISQMLSLAKPGGTIALQDYDRVSCVCYPEHPSWTILLGAYDEAFRASGGDGGTGRALPWLLRSAGAQDVQAKVHAKLVDMDSSRRTHHLGLLEVMHEKIVSFGRLKESELAEHKQALRRHLADPDTVVIDHLLVQAWGRKPC